MGVKKPIKLAFCTDGIFPDKVGGMQRHSRLLIEELVKYPKLDITVFHPHRKKVFKTFDNLREIQIEEIDVSKNYLKECKSYSERIYNHLKGAHFDVIYSQGLSVWYKAEEFSDKLIVNPHGLEPFQAIGIKDKLIAVLFKKVFNSVFKQAKYVVSLGGELTTILKKNIGKTELVVLPNATNLPAIKSEKKWPEANESLQLLFVSRFAKNKGIHVLMEVIEKLNASGYQNSFFFHLAGKGPLYEDYIKNHQHANVKYWGFISDDDLNTLYKEVDGFVFPTLFEGMPTVVLEAMANQLPIIVTNVGATAELVDEENGYLIERNNAKALEEALLNYYELDKSQKESLSNSSYQKVETNFTWHMVAKRHYELFENMV